MPKSFFGIIMVGGFLAGINAKTKLKDFNLDISDYDEIIIGSPVWNARISSPINTVLSRLNFEGEILSFILYSGSGTAKVAVKKIKKLYKDSSINILKETKKTIMIYQVKYKKQGVIYGKDDCMLFFSKWSN